MNDIDTSQLLTQMRAMAAAAQGQEAGPQTNGVAGDFGALLKQSIDGVNGLQKDSKRLGEAFLLGDSSVGLVDVMVAKQKASIAFEATMQVRNKLVSAYKEIMAMQV